MYLSNRFHSFQISSYKIYSSLNQFGAVKHISFIVQADRRYAYCWVHVEFYESQSVDTALSKRQINIADHIFEIRRTKCEIHKRKAIQIDKILLKAPVENSPKNILNILNDDCLREIFKKLTFQSQCAGLGVCVRFNQISKEFLAKKHKTCVFDTHILLETLLSLPLQQANDYLRNFGPSIYEINANNMYNLSCHRSMWEEKGQIVLGMISKHCKNIRKLELDLSYLYLKDIQWFSELFPLFMRLDKLHLRLSFGLTDRWLDPLLPICSQLSALSLKNYELKYPLPPIRLPKLVAFRIDISYVTKNSHISSLKTFLSLNTQLEVFSYSNGNQWILYDNDSEKHDSVIGQLKRLKILVITTRKFRIIPLIRELLSNNVQIEHLKLRLAINIDEMIIEYISQMKTIRKLELDTYRAKLDLDEQHIIHLASRLSNLEAMLLRRGSKIDLILVDGDIHHIVKELKEKLPEKRSHVSTREVNKISHFLLDSILKLIFFIRSLLPI